MNMILREIFCIPSFEGRKSSHPRFRPRSRKPLGFSNFLLSHIASQGQARLWVYLAITSMCVREGDLPLHQGVSGRPWE